MTKTDLGGCLLALLLSTTTQTRQLAEAWFDIDAGTVIFPVELAESCFPGAAPPL